MANIVLSRNGKDTPFAIHGKLHVEGSHLIDEKGQICELRGLSTHNLSTYPEYINEEAITQFTDEYGISIFRLALYSAEADDCKGYADGDDAHRADLEKLIVKGVEICAKLGIYVLVDWHILFDYNPNMNADMSEHFWNAICPQLKEYDNVIYEICNEPNMDIKRQCDETSWEDVTKYANRIIPVIRKLDSEKVVIVGTPTWSQRVDQAADAPLSFDNIMYTLHFYADTHREDLREKLRYALSKDLPIFVTEYGICNAAGDGAVNDEETTIWLKLLQENKISYVLWNLSNKNETSAILKDSCTKTAGFTEDDLSPCGQRFKTMMNKRY